jgi:hypothetical protein
VPVDFLFNTARQKATTAVACKSEKDRERTGSANKREYSTKPEEINIEMERSTL